MFSHFTQNCILLYFLQAHNPYFVTKSCWKSSYICVFILSKKQRNWFHKNLHNSGMVGRRKLPDPSLNRVFNALSIGVQYKLSFQWTNFGLKCLSKQIFYCTEVEVRCSSEIFIGKCPNFLKVNNSSDIEVHLFQGFSKNFVFMWNWCTSKVYLESSRTSAMELNSWRLKYVNYFLKKTPS